MGIQIERCERRIKKYARETNIFLVFSILLGLPSARAAQVEELRDPRIAVIVSEIHITRPAPDPAGETAIIRKLLEAGFSRIVDKNQVEAIRKSDVGKALLNGDTSAAINIGVQFGIDYILAGEAFSELVGREPNGYFSCRARLEARLIRTDNAQIAAAHGFHAGGLDLTELTASKKSLNNAGELMGGYMVEQLTNVAGREETGVKLTITGISGFSKVSEIQKALSGLKGVKNVHMREYNGVVATIDLDVTISPQALAERISEISAPRLEVTEISGSAMKIHFVVTSE